MAKSSVIVQIVLQYTLAERTTQNTWAKEEVQYFSNFTTSFS